MPMKIVYLPQTRADLRWMKDYYSRIFPEGARQARMRFKTAAQLLEDNPEIGRLGPIAGTWEFVIAKTPFIIFYRIQMNRIEILRIWDGRALRSNEASDSAV
ncbi:type II toxin-antitoxin system RelE/ParE family toxin [Neorhizobium lilium]|uniref:Type II toxin-antitoxin system RelE/ParE family toxin n=1 Tax=Neorhizobium lilium TaxID=2503024 RepID=A0A3S3RR46_9HYPH|nr:type II toxin-antitoxin system RelE/ParE family toxin [Neorhizobium lilium]RWX75864.1 type II toxin-antitoxin system RelE/ParE family toxin [Neorhizobium lilium]